MSPKEWVKRDLVNNHGLLADQADEFWQRLQEYALSQLREQTASTAPYPALLFDGKGGDIVSFYLSVCDEKPQFNWKHEANIQETKDAINNLILDKLDHISSIQCYGLSDALQATEDRLVRAIVGMEFALRIIEAVESKKEVQGE